jgi:hypothetical protein
MAIVQISRITHRQGLAENLPQLAGGELGWSIDDRKLYIGNGTLTDGAPVIGNTEVLTEFSDVLALASSYTYKGDAGGYTVVTGATAAAPITRKLQEKFDDFASVKDFGAKGDGTTDDTAAINRALYELFSRQVSAEIRRSLYFPAGTYIISDTIKIPSYAKLWGEGADSSVIKLSPADSSFPSYLARTTDSLQQTGTNIGLNAAILPKQIEVSDLTFESAIATSVFLLESTSQAYFNSVNFIGGDTVANLGVATANTKCFEIKGSSTSIPEMVTVDKCQFRLCTYGFHCDDDAKGVTVSNSRFYNLFRGAVLGENKEAADTGPQAFRIVHNLFDEIASAGVYIANVNYNCSGYNTFLDVGNSFNGEGNAATHVIQLLEDDNVSIGDMFERSDANSTSFSRIKRGSGKKVVAFDGAKTIIQGEYERQSGLTATLTDGVSTDDSTDSTIFVLANPTYKSFKIDYSILRGDTHRIGTVKCAVGPMDSTGAGSLSIQWSDGYVENSDTGVVLQVIEEGTDIEFHYTTTVTGDNATIHYSISHLN